MHSYVSEDRAGTLLGYCLSVSLLIISISTPAAAQPTPGATPTAGTVDRDLNKHEFNRGESIYDKPDSARVVLYSSIARNQTAMSELAALVVDYQSLEQDENHGVFNEAKRRELGLRKVALYDKYNLSLPLLKVPKSKMPAYLAYWPDFWRKVDEFKRSNPGIQGPGPFVLPREGRLASLREGAMSMAQGLGDVFALNEAFAKEVDDFPRCSVLQNLAPVEIQPCIPNDERYFYFRTIAKSNNGPDGVLPLTPDGRIGRSHSATISSYQENYEDDYMCRYHRNRHHLIGSIRLLEKKETDICGTNAGDNAYRLAREKKVTFRKDGQAIGYMNIFLRCFPSAHPYNNREANPDLFREHKLTSEPVWLCDK